MASLALVEDFPNTNLRDIPAMLRKWADRIEANETGYAEPSCCVIVLVAPVGLKVAGFGNDSAASQAHVVLCKAARQIEDSLLE